MSRIDELVHELCPDGVEHAGVLDIADYVRGITYSKNDEDLAGEIQVLRANNITLASNTLNFEDVKRVSSHVRVREAQRLRAGDTLICAGSGSRDHIGKVAYIREDIDPTFGGFMAVLRTTDVRVESRFLFHLLTGERFKAHLDRSLSTSTINNLNASVMRGFRVPVPPLEVQREIVRVLDTFTQLEAELEAELEARRAQYEHYRAGLLKFDLDQVDSVTVLDGFETRNGYTPAKSDPTNWTNGTVPWFRMEDIRENGRVLDSALQTIPEKAVKGGRYFPANSLIFATSATIGEHALITVPFMANQRFTAIWPKQDYADRFDMKFLFYYGFVIDEWCRNNTTTSSFASVDMVNFKRLRIPIPPMEEQKCVANQLDHFDALVYDISIGLPAELASRRKQYEYYRDRLLTFKEEAV